ncbi:uncharacterized protein LOC143819680 [Paroedura picta]|uniref:uncharacterized protein LOC143819680 n=1 Tax=Paroedura picta TaxID=143630 RepID=UPI004055B032
MAKAAEREGEEEEGPSTSSQAAAETIEARMQSVEARLASLEGLVEQQRRDWQAEVAEVRGELERQRQQREEEEVKKKEEEDLFKRKVRGTVTRLSKRLREMAEGGGKGAGEGSSGT